VLPGGADNIRAIPYLNITCAQIRESIEIIRSVAASVSV